MVHLLPFTGKTIVPYLPDLARLRMEVFRDFPYLYDGNLDYEVTYLQTYSQADESLFVVAFAGETVIGVATGLPLSEEEEAFKRPFHQHNLNPDTIFYFGESVLLAPYRGQGIGARFFQEREKCAHASGRFSHTAFCAVERPNNHPCRPPNYIPLDDFWSRQGYVKFPALATTYVWKDLNEDQPSPKPMTFWLKKLK